MSKVSAERSGSVKNEIHVWGLTIHSSSVYPDQGLTKMDLHIKFNEAKDLCEALQEILKVQTQGQGRNKSLSQAETTAT